MYIKPTIRMVLDCEAEEIICQSNIEKGDATDEFDTKGQVEWDRFDDMNNGSGGSGSVWDDEW